jgi:uncharacterized membrane protein
MTRRFKPNVSLVAMSWGMRSAMLRPWNLRMRRCRRALCTPRFWGNGLATLDIVSVASDIADAGTALAGLILVYLGAVAVRFETLDPKEQSSARDVYRRHARRAFRGIVIALVAATAALTAKSLKSEPYATMIAAMACIALLMSFFIAVMAAYWILRSID